MFGKGASAGSLGSARLARSLVARFAGFGSRAGALFQGSGSSAPAHLALFSPFFGVGSLLCICCAPCPCGGRACR